MNFFNTALVKTILINAPESVDFGCWGIDEFLHSKVWMVGYFILICLCKWICLHFLFETSICTDHGCCWSVMQLCFLLLVEILKPLELFHNQGIPPRLDDSSWYYNQWISSSVGIMLSISFRSTLILQTMNILKKRWSLSRRLVMSSGITII